MRYLLPLALAALSATASFAQNSITDAHLAKFRQESAASPADRALNNAVALNGLKSVGQSANNSAYDTHFSNEVKSQGITDQQKSGRCWLFSGLNVLRAKMIQRYNLGAFTFSQNYLFFYDQLEKSNLFLQAVIDSASLPMNSRYVDWLFKNPISDGGAFCAVADLVLK